MALAGTLVAIPWSLAFLQELPSWFWVVLLILLILGMIVALFRPLFGRREPWELPWAGEGAREVLGREKERVLRLLKDLDLERESGAIDEERYAELRQSYLAQAALLNRRIAALGGSRAPQRPAPPAAVSAERETE